tara:strand:+ start:29 stop:1648 length:1620 start_codon:yes stop_codon:yes gene_type:complete
MKRKYNFIIIGAGSAGCVLANRLSADNKNSVLLIEAGPKDLNPLYRIPLLAGVMYRYRYNNWFYFTESEKNLNNRKIFWPRGKLLGGSSSINGMIYTRGLANDYNYWRQLGLNGWSWDDVLPIFKKSELSNNKNRIFHGEKGPLPVTKNTSIHELSQKFINAGIESNYRVCNDFNNGFPDGLGIYDFTIKEGKRQSTSKTFLKEAAKRKNLDIATSCLVEKLIIKDNLCTGVKVLINGKKINICASKKIILSAGTINSPKLLMQSGIGSFKELNQFGINLINNLPGVGKNLQDHLLVRVQVASKNISTLYNQLRWNVLVKNLFQALLFNSGDASFFPLTVGGYLRSNPNLDEPDLQTHFLPGLSTGKVRFPWSRKTYLDQPGFFANIYQLRPHSRGEILLNPKNIYLNPIIHANYLSSHLDMECLREGVKLLRKIFSQASLKPFIKYEIEPGDLVRSNEEIENWISKNADTVFHPVGTCKMGTAEDTKAVVDSQMKVFGIENLMIADASVMPTMPSANTNAPTIMIAEKAAELIIKEHT